MVKLVDEVDVVIQNNGEKESPKIVEINVQVKARNSAAMRTRRRLTQRRPDENC